MNVSEARKIIVTPYVTEKTFEFVETEAKVCFMVKNTASKPMISEAIKTLYDEMPIKVNTARTVYGKKAFVEFESIDKARDLATKIGVL